MQETTCRFIVGQIVIHQLFDYRGVIFDIDPEFQGTEEWYDQVAKSRPPKDKPWYHVLVHNETHTTYVAERNLGIDPLPAPIVHPLVSRYFVRFEKGVYQVMMH